MGLDEKNAYKITKRLAFPRLIGSGNDLKAIQIVKDEFRKINIEPISDRFETSYANWIIARYAFIPIYIILIISAWLFFTTPIITIITSSIFLILGIYISQMSGGNILSIGKKFQTENIRGELKSENSKIRVVLMAHWDSKSQSFPASIRIVVLIITLLGGISICILYLIFGIYKLIFGTSNITLEWILFYLTIIFSIFGFSNYFNKLGNKSPGALDNAAAVGTVLELARFFKNEKELKNTDLIFLITGSEELNLGGAIHYLKSNLDELKKLKTFFINLDPIGANESISIVSGWGIPKKHTSKKLINLYKKAANELNIPFKTYWLPFGAFSDLMPVINFGFEGCWLANLDVKNIHTKNDTIELISKNALKYILEATVKVIENLDKESDMK